MHFPARAASILFFSIFGHEIGVQKSPTLLKRKELQVTHKVMCFLTNLIRERLEFTAVVPKSTGRVRFYPKSKLFDGCKNANDLIVNRTPSSSAII